MIRFEHVYQSFQAGSFQLSDLNLEIEAGEFIFLIGSSGAGKTSIIKLILRETLPTKGNIYINEELISDKNFKKIQALRQKIGIIFQDFKIIQDKSVLENIMISAEILNNKKPKDEAMTTLEKVGLYKKALFFPTQLSAGETQRLAIARAICGGRKIILADEPTGNLDPITSWEIVKLFRKIHTKDTVIIFATHNSDIVNTLKNRVVVIKKGKIIKDSREGKYSLDQK